MMIYKVLRGPEWRQFQDQWSTTGAPVDLADGYIHFSTAETLPGTLEKHFSGEDGLWLLACDAEQTFSPPSTSPVVWIIDVTDGSAARDLSHELRAAGIATDRSFDHRSMRSQMKAADRSGAGWALIIGDQELATGVVTLRNLRSDVAQQTLARSEVVSAVAEVLSR